MNIFYKKYKQLYIGRALLLVWQSSPSWTIARLIFVILQGLMSLLSIYLTKVIVDVVTASLTISDKKVAFAHVLSTICVVGIVALIGIFSNTLASLISQIQDQIIVDYVFPIIHAKSIEIDLEYYENPQYHDIFYRAQQQASSRLAQILNRLASFFQNIVFLLGVSSLLILVNWNIALILFASIVPRILVRLKYMGYMHAWQYRQTATLRQINYYGEMLTSNVYAKEIRLYNLGSLFSHRFMNFRKLLRKEFIGLVTKNSIADLVTQTSFTIATFVCYAFIAYQTVEGKLTLGSLVMYSQAFQLGYNALWQLLSNLSNFYEDNLYLSNLYEFLDLKPKILEPTHPQPIPPLQQKGIQFHNVSFQYPTSNRQGLTNISLNIPPGKIVALVGENGAGKTTLIKLLCRLYDPTEGTITFEGQDLRSFAISDLRRQIGVIFQDYAKYHLTAQENIWLGNIDLPPGDRRITEAARQSGADEVITGLPDNYETILGSWFETGEELSIGQWQKIALARAFLRNAQILILDEPSSSLDAKAEEEIFQKFRQLIQGQTAILISHRLSTVKMSDHIYFLENGKIIENGTHQELMQLGGHYAHLFETQAQHYR